MESTEEKSRTDSEKAVEKISKAKESKELGNNFFKSQNYKKALYHYHVGLMYLKGVECDAAPAVIPKFTKSREVTLTEENLSDVESLTVDLHNNVGACLLKQSAIKYNRVLECALKVTEKRPDNLKALYRTALAQYHLQEYEKAKDAIRLAITVGGDKDSAVRKLSSLVNEKLKEEDKEYKKLYKDTLLSGSFK